jgi:hypothetical protein
LQFFYGGHLPEFREGTIIDLTVPRHAIKDQRFIEILESEESKEIFQKGDKLYAAVSSAKIPDRLKQAAYSMDILLNRKVDQVIGSLIQNTLFVEVVLQEPLSLQLRGTKHGRLKPVKCSIPSLSKEADSLNQAFYLISSEFELGRKSHVGNAFKQFWIINPGKQPFPLEELRMENETKKEKVDYGPDNKLL